MFYKRANVEDQLLDLSFGQLALVTGHLVFAFLDVGALTGIDELRYSPIRSFPTYDA